MKKFLALMMMIVMALTVAACGGGDKKADNKAAGAKVDRSKEFITVLTGPTSGIYFPIVI